MLKKSLSIIGLFIILIILVLAWSLANQSASPIDINKSELSVGDNIFSVVIADTATTRARGLSGRESLPEDSGMFFIFDRPQVLTFWMKGMKFPLDIIWIRDNEVIGFVENVPVDDSSELIIYTPPGLADKVLEINAGLVEKLNIKVGDTVSL